MIKINLLPSEFLIAEREYQNFRKIQLICVLVILSLIFLSSMTIALRVLQSQRIVSANEQLDQLTSKITADKSKEAQLLILKNRIDLLQKISESPSKQKALYNLVNQLIPKEVLVSDMSVDNSGNIGLSLVVLQTGYFENMLDNLTSKEKNEGKIKTIEIETLTRTRDGVYRANIKVKPV